MRRALVIVLAGASALILAASSSVWIGLRSSLAQLDGEVVVSGITAPIIIERDDDGIPTITAVNRNDVAFATGFAHAQDRFFQMDLLRRQAAGELSEIIGERALEADKRLRFHRFRARAQRMLAQTPSEDRAILDHYAAGVNAGLAALGARPFEYYLLGVEPQPWRPEDTALVVYTMYLELNDERAINDVRRGLAHSVLPKEVYDWMYPQGTPWDAPLVGEPRPVAPIPKAEVYSLRDYSAEAPPAMEIGRYPLRGSNSWAVSGNLTESGRAIVSNDMHLGLRIPNIYYQARLVVAGDEAREVTGVSLPGAPFIVAGSNSRIAWGYTNSYGDWSDAVLLVPGSTANTYRTPEGEAAFVLHDEIIRVKGAEPVEYQVRETVWGPVLDDVDYPDGEIAVSWIAHKPDGVNIRLIELETALSVFEAIDIANTLSIPPQNFVTGDADGNIAWTIAGKIPRKSHFNPMRPADWSNEHGWQGWLPADEYPRIINPASGRIWTANARVVDAEALEIVGDGGYDLGARARQIRDALMAKRTFEPVDMLTIQYDDRALFLTPWRNLLLELLTEDVIASDARLAEYRRLVEGWIPRAAPESVGYRLVRAFRLELEKRIFHALMVPVRATYGEDVSLRRSNQFEAVLWSLVTERPEHMLPADYASWEAFLLATVRENIRYFESEYEGPLNERTWGEINTAAIRHPLSAAIPLLGDYLNMPQEGLSGDLDMPKAQGPSFGAAERFAIAPGDEANSLMLMPTGQSGHPLSDFYGKGHDAWVRGRPSPFLPGNPRHTLTLKPGTG
ncbi:MAG: penicillin acylase family protein [Gammaproteobacteria bacterium]